MSCFIQSKFVSLCFFCQFCIMQLSGSAGEIRSRRNRDPPKPYSENSERIQPFLLLRFAIVSLTQKDRTFSENSLTRMFVPEAVLSNPSACLPRKEVIQPHLPIRLPCYDFTPVINLTFGGSFLAVRSPTSGALNSHGVTGGVYKARERIHRDILIRDY